MTGTRSPHLAPPPPHKTKKYHNRGVPLPPSVPGMDLRFPRYTGPVRGRLGQVVMLRVARYDLSLRRLRGLPRLPPAF